MPIRWGIVTAAKICHDFVNAFNSYPNRGDQVIAAVASRDKSKAEAFAKTHNIAKVFDSYEALAASNDIDVAYIGSLIPYHYELAKLFLSHGKHVLCEKPLCQTYKQVESLVRLARKKNVFLMEAVWSRFSPSYIALEKEINSGKLGDVQFVEVNFGVPISDIDRIRLKEMGGSAILDIGIYALQFAQYIFKDKPIKVTAVGELNEHGVDMMDTVILDYTGGRRAVLNVHARIKLANNATVTGTKGQASVEDPFHFPLSLIHVDGKVEQFPLHESKLPYYFGNSAGLVYEAIEVARCIRAGLIESPRMTHEDSLTISGLETEVRKQVGVYFEVDDKEFP